MSNNNAVLESEHAFKREKIMFGKIKKLFFVGIGGAGMSGIAEILFNLGYDVLQVHLNSQRQNSFRFSRLLELVK